VRPLFLALFLAGCPSSGLHGLTPAWQHTTGPLETAQACLPDPGVLEVADAALVALLRTAAAQGVVQSYSEAAGRVGRPAICVVAEPEMCGAVLGAGCTHRNGIWLMRSKWRELITYELANWLYLRLGPDRAAWTRVEEALR